MTKIETLEKKLRTVFNPEQAHILAEVVDESYSELVKTSDFNELKEIVRDLAVAQKGTEQNVAKLEQNVSRLEHSVSKLEQSVSKLEGSVEKLEGAQSRTEGALQKLEVAQSKTEASVQKLEVAQSKTEASVQKLEVAQSKTEASVQKLEIAQSRTEKEIRNLARQVGGLSESFGGSLEDFAIDLVPELLEKYWKMQIENAGRDSFVVNNKDVEIDLVIRGKIESRPVIVLGEVKSNLTLKEASGFISLVKTLPLASQGEVKIIFFGYRAQRDARDFIKSAGASMVFTHGKIL